MWARTGASLSWPRTLALTLAGLVAQPLSAQESMPVDEPAQRYLSEGRAQIERLDYPSAKQSLERAIAAVEHESGAGSDALIEPLLAMSEVQVAMRQPDAAAESLRRAIAIVRRSEGLYAERQFRLLITLVDLDSDAGRLGPARRSLGQLLRVVDRAYAENAQDRARALGEIADWQCRIGEFVDARRTYREALDALETSDEDTAAEGVEALLAETMSAFARCCLQELSAEGIATTSGEFERYRGRINRTERMNPVNPAFRNHLNRVLRWEGERALRRAALSAQSGRLDPQRSLALLLQAGDWFQIKDHYRAARSYYAQAEQIAKNNGIEHPLATPVQLLYPLPPAVLRAHGNAHSADTTARYVEVEFRVHADGTVDTERVIEREFGKSTVNEVLNALGVARYRPRFVDGRAVDTDGVRLRQGIPDLR